jgi:hypothetical protein
MKIVPESAGHAKRMYALHSHFMTEWKPGEEALIPAAFCRVRFPGTACHGIVHCSTSATLQTQNSA